MAAMKQNPNGKGVMAPMEYTSWFIAPIKKAWFYERFFIGVVMVKDKNVMIKKNINTVQKIKCQ